MSRLVIAVATSLVVAACGLAGDPASGPSTTTTSTTPTTIGTTTSPGPGPPEMTAGILAAAIEQLITVDHTFGGGSPPFSRYLIQASLDPEAGSATAAGKTRPLTDEERAAIQAVVEVYGPVTWIDDPREWRTENLEPTVEGAVILGVGEPQVDGQMALVPVSLWCGGLCGTWLTYQVEKVTGAWVVTGIEGPIAIS